MSADTSDAWSDEDFYEQLDDLLSVNGVFVTKDGKDLIEKFREDWQLLDRQEAVNALIENYAGDFSTVSALVMADSSGKEMSTIDDLREAVEPITRIIERISNLAAIEDVGNSYLFHCVSRARL